MAHVTSPEPCARCGGDADFEIAALWLCVDCYHVAGSTCAGIGRTPASSIGAPVVEPAEGDPLAADQVC